MEKQAGIQAASLSEYLDNYRERLQEGLQAVSRPKLQALYDLLKETIAADGTVFVAGNGGSCAIAEHLCCDWVKGPLGTRQESALRVFSLASNNAVLTALANDFSYAEVFSAQVKYFARPKDMVLLISSSGNSPNVLRAAEAARAMGMKSAALTGFSGGKLMELADICVHVPVDNYGIVEDAHQAIMHSIAQFLALQKNSK